MLSVLPVTDDHTWLSKLRAELRDSINHPTDPTNTTPSRNPPPTASKTDDRARSTPQGYHHVGRTLPSAAIDFDSEVGVASKVFTSPTRIPNTNSRIYCPWNFDS
jgi:hypothetical protein